MTDWRKVAMRAVQQHQALHDPAELAVLLGLLDSQQPSTALELGTHQGGLCWALGWLPYMRRIVTVDVAPYPLGPSPFWSHPCDLFTIGADSTDPGTLASVVGRLGGRALDVLVVDGGHDYATARSDWDTYAPLVRDGGLAVVHDTQGYPGHPEIEVPKLWAELLADHQTVELVAHPGGPFGTGVVWM